MKPLFLLQFQRSPMVSTNNISPSHLNTPFLFKFYFCVCFLHVCDWLRSWSLSSLILKYSNQTTLSVKTLTSVVSIYLANNLQKTVITEILKIFSRKQHQYHSQRQSRGESELRPVSNFYEYESVQSILNTQGGRMNGNVHITTSPQPPPPPLTYQIQDLNANSLPRQQPVNINVRHHPLRSYTTHHQHRGPFVTQVTIGEHVQSNGTKV